MVHQVNANIKVQRKLTIALIDHPPNRYALFNLHSSFTKRYSILFPLIFLNIKLWRNNRNKKVDNDITFFNKYFEVRYLV